MCLCVARYQWCGCVVVVFALFVYFCLTVLLCVLFTVHASPVLVGLGFFLFLCLRDVAVVSLVGFGGGGGDCDGD